jgi:hypothetical protein
MAGLDPAIRCHGRSVACVAADCRVKPGNDEDGDVSTVILKPLYSPAFSSRGIARARAWARGITTLTAQRPPVEISPMTDPVTQITPDFQRGWDAAILAARDWHESQAKQTLIQAKRNRFPKNLEREAEVHQRSAEMIATLKPDDV